MATQLSVLAAIYFASAELSAMKKFCTMLGMQHNIYLNSKWLIKVQKKTDTTKHTLSW